MTRRLAALLCLTTTATVSLCFAWQEGYRNQKTGDGGRAVDAEKRADAPIAIPLPEVCGIPLRSPRITWETLSDVQGGLKQKNFNVVQRATDIFAWQQFIALNWPAREGARGAPDRAKKFTAPGPRVWETWKETTEVYLPCGARPPDWNSPGPLPEACKGHTRARVLFRKLKIDDLVDSRVQAAAADGTLPPTLTDQRGNLVLYEIRMNRVLFDYVRDNQYYDAKRQAAAKSIQIPDGAMLVKAAWRQVAAEEETRFHTIEACIADSKDLARAKYRVRKMGLVGWHLMCKTPSAPSWIWSTFEQVDNVVGKRPSFYNPHCPDGLTNKQTPAGIPNQVVRVTPIPSADPDCTSPKQSVDNVRQLDEAVRHGLEPSVFHNYELVGAQWPIRKASSAPTPPTVFEVLPGLLANTTMETYVQGTSSCMGCHAMARSANAASFVSADFSFTLNDALPVQTDPQLISPPVRPVSAWDRKEWNSVLRGYDLATRSYELLPDFVGAKLHCSSCHLNAGGNPTAAWWVGMTKKYNYPATQALQDRINRCFQHSMNGKPLCSTRAKKCSCGDDPNMNALITYMQWLDEQAKALGLTPPKTPLPPLPTLKGDPGRGRMIFGQKCAVCHGANGEGRYASDTYFRPALWGAHSFNQQAGFDSSTSLAPFVRWNMPFGSGGLLTDLEAWDVATFIDKQERPKGP